MHPAMKIPEALRPGDTVAIVSPASAVREEYIDGAVRTLAELGFGVRVMPSAKGPASGSYAASDALRLADITAAYSDPEVRAILCARGGYGCNHLLDSIPTRLVADDPKWLIGFSDVSALHALSARAGVASMHAPMAKHLTQFGRDDRCVARMVDILAGRFPVEHETGPHPLNHYGHAEGRLTGGNLAVINGLASTPFDPLALSALADRPILFIEDISEAIYAVERMLLRLRMSGALGSISGLVVGAFTEYRPDRNHPDMETMISRLLEDAAIDIPVAFGFPAGHVDYNLPLVLGSRATLDVSPRGVTLRMEGK